ncbi:MAG: SURF1 family protein [Burkholderiales bacterium]
MNASNATRARRPALVPTLAAIAVIAVCVSAGLWQRGRMEQKLALRAQVESASKADPVAMPRATAWDDWRFRPVRATGVFDAAHQILIDNRIRGGRAGYDVVAPLALTDGRVVLVDRGWVPAGASRAELPQVPPPAGQVTVAGRINRPPAAYLELGAGTVQGRVWQNLDLARYEAATGLAVLPVIVEQTAAAGPGDDLVRDWPAPDLGAEKHMSYMLQWFAFAATTLGLWGYFTWRRPK